MNVMPDNNVMTYSIVSLFNHLPAKVDEAFFADLCSINLSQWVEYTDLVDHWHYPTRYDRLEGYILWLERQVSIQFLGTNLIRNTN